MQTLTSVVTLPLRSYLTNLLREQLAFYVEEDSLAAALQDRDLLSLGGEVVLPQLHLKPRAVEEAQRQASVLQREADIARREMELALKQQDMVLNGVAPARTRTAHRITAIVNSGAEAQRNLDKAVAVQQEQQKVALRQKLAARRARHAQASGAETRHADHDMRLSRQISSSGAQIVQGGATII